MAVGRFAPSPSGPLHLGNLRTALVAWLFARAAGDRFVLRVEDLDLVASRDEHVRSHQCDLEAIGLDWDSPVVRQSARFDRYRAVLDGLGERELLYPCYCTRREIQDALVAAHGPSPSGAYPGTCRELSAGARAAREDAGRPPAWRVRGGTATVRFTDRLCGTVEQEVDDFVVQRNDGAPAYNLAVVVDDHEQGIEEVVRGDDLLHTTGRQLFLYDLLGWEAPAHAHVPLVLGPDGERLAKRHGSVTLDELAARGVDADAVRAALARSLGLAADGEQPTMAALRDRFDPARLPRAPWVLDPTAIS